MKSRSQFLKLQELRTKTDRELVIIIDRELDLAFYFGSLAQTGCGSNSAELPRTGTQIDFIEAAKLVARIDNLGERLRLEAKIRQLREELEQWSAPLRARTAYS